VLPLDGSARYEIRHGLCHDEFAIKPANGGFSNP